MKTKIISGLMLLFVTAFSLFADVYTLTGTVTDNGGTALPGVTVMVKGSNNGTVTDMNGKYSIGVTEKDEYLVFSFIGYINEEVKINGRKIIDVQMLEDMAELDEVVVVGYGHRKASFLAEAVSSVSFKSRACEAQPQFNTEGYSTIHENGFKNAKDNPLSTFSIDVDRASYSNVRRFINNGQLPPVDAVRIEEMINYFTYDYEEPNDEHPFSIHYELSECPWNTENQLLHIGLQGKKIPTENLPASNIVFLIDVSGSMGNYNKLPLLKSAFKMLTNNLRETDRVAMVVYAGSSGLVLPSTPGSNKQKIIESLDRLEAGGSTAGGAGLKLAYKVATENYIDGGNNRIILATDGDFNVGGSSNAEMERLIETEREKGIFISVLGFGMGNYKDDKMEIIANKGNGNYAYIDNMQEAKKVLVSEFGGTLFTIAKDVKFQLEFNPAKVKSYRLVGYENRLLNNEDFEDDKKDAGEMGAGHTVTALYEITPAKGKNKGEIKLKYQDTEIKEAAYGTNELLTLKMRYKEPDGMKSQLMEKIVHDNVHSIEETSENFRFAVAVAQFGMLLRNSEHKGQATFDNTLALAQSAKGKDEENYRGEFIGLVESARHMK
jgi:Ca-activated chloride channel homolog